MPGSRAQSKKDLIIQVWEQLDRETLGAAELHLIQQAISETLGARAVDSPATIARVLADEGVPLRHPEVLDFDSEWRLQAEAGFDDVDFSSLQKAPDALKHLDAVRQASKQKGDELTLWRVDQFVREAVEDLKRLAGNNAGSEIARREAKELSQWLSLWLQTPELFADWLELRLGSADFRELFPDFSKHN